VTDQTNPPRTRDEQIEQQICEVFDFYAADDHTTEISRGDLRLMLQKARAEALAELRAGAEPFQWVRLDKNGVPAASWAFKPGEAAFAYARSRCGYIIPVYAQPMPAAELAAEVERLREALTGIKIYADDTLSGPADGLSDALWFADGVREIGTRARAALATTQEGKSHDQS